MLDVFRGISSQDIALAMRHMNAQNYVEHNPLVDGRFEGARRYLDQVAARRPDWKLIRVFRDGAYVVTQVGGRLPDQGVFFDVFRFEDALIVEHWVFSAEAGPPNKSGHMQVDGATEPKSGEDTGKSKALVRDYYQKVESKLEVKLTRFRGAPMLTSEGAHDPPPFSGRFLVGDGVAFRLLS